MDPRRKTILIVPTFTGGGGALGVAGKGTYTIGTSNVNYAANDNPFIQIITTPTTVAGSTTVVIKLQGSVDGVTFTDISSAVSTSFTSSSGTPVNDYIQLSKPLPPHVQAVIAVTNAGADTTTSVTTKVYINGVAI